MHEQKKAIDMTPEELNEWLASLPAQEDDSSYPHFLDADPYFKLEHKSDEQRSSCWFGKDEHLTVHNHCSMRFLKSLLSLSPVKPPTALTTAMTEPAACPPIFLITWQMILKKFNDKGEKFKNV